jgi:hypothetical protein
MYVHCAEMYMYCRYSTYVHYQSVSPLVVQSYTIQDEAVNPLTPRKCTDLNGNFVFDLQDFFRNIILESNENCLYYATKKNYTKFLQLTIPTQ